MSLTTTTFPNVFERAARGIERKAGRPYNAAVERLSQFVLPFSESSLRQILAFGADRWSETWLRADRIPGTRESGDERGPSIRATLRHTRGGFFQLLFVPPHRIVAPVGTSVKDKIIDWGRFTTAHASVRGTLPSADLIPDDFAVNLLLVTESQKLLTPKERLLLKSEVTFLERLKLLWDALGYLTDTSRKNRDVRFMVVKQPSLKLQSHYPNTPPPDPQALGLIVYMRSKGDGSDEFVPSIYRSLYDAFRKTLHQEYGHRAEEENILALREAIKDFVLRCDNEWRAATITPDRKEALKEEAATLAENGAKLLSLCQNKYKRKAAQLLELAGPMRDKRNKDNPSVALRRFSLSRQDLGERAGEIRAVQSYNSIDRSLLKGALTSHQGAINRAISTLQTLGKLVKDDHAFFTRKTTVPTQEVLAEKLLNQAKTNRLLGETLFIKPFSAFGQIWRPLIDRLQAAMVAQDKPRFTDLIHSAHETLFAFQALRLVELVHTFRIEPPKDGVKEINRSLRELRSLFGTPFYSHPLQDGDAQATCTALTTLVQTSKNFDLAKLGEWALYAALSKALEPHDLQAELDQLHAKLSAQISDTSAAPVG